MNSTIVLIVTLLQLLVALGSYVMQSSAVFYGLVVYGSPFYLAMTMLTKESAITDNTYLYVLLGLYHIVKYFFFFRAQMVDEQNAKKTVAIVLEAAYLGLSAYYII